MKDAHAIIQGKPFSKALRALDDYPDAGPGAKISDDLEIILREAEKHGTLNLLKRVPIYFDEVELRTIVHALRR